MRAGAIAIAVAALAGCEVDLERMIDQPSYRSYEPNPYLPGGTTLQPPPAGTVSRSAVVGPPELVSGAVDGRPVEAIPIPLSREVLLRGQNRFTIFCAVCHGRSGHARTEVAENMTLRPPPSLHEPRLVRAPAGHVFRVASEGYGLMPSYAEKLSVADRWAVVAYVQALQLSQAVELAELPQPLEEEARPWLE